jgi:hypothetical protein
VSSKILTWEDTHCPSSVELYDFDLRRHVLSIIWGALWICPEKARTVHHLGSSTILTVEGMYSPSSADVMGTLWFWTEKARTLRYLGKCWGALWFWPEKARSVCHLGTCWGALWFWPKRARPFHHLERRAGELCGFDWRVHVLSIIWGSSMVLSPRGHLLSTIWGRAWCSMDLT